MKKPSHATNPLVAGLSLFLAVNLAAPPVAWTADGTESAERRPSKAGALWKRFREGVQQLPGKVTDVVPGLNPGANPARSPAQPASPWQQFLSPDLQRLSPDGVVQFLGRSGLAPDFLQRAGGLFPGATISRGKKGEILLPLVILGVTTMVIAIKATARQREEAKRRGDEARERQARTVQSAPVLTPGGVSPAVAVPVDPAPVPPVASAPSGAGATSTTATATNAPLLAIEVPRDGAGTANADGAVFMVYDPVTGEVVGDEVYEVANRPRDQEKVRIGERELTYVGLPAQGNNQP